MGKLGTVKIEAGKFYRTREGEKVGPMRKYDGDSWADERLIRLWKDDGSRYYGDLDGVIISEWTEAPKFKVGDRVRVKSEYSDVFDRWCHMREFTIGEIDSDGDVWYCGNGSGGVKRCVNRLHIELISATDPAAAFTIDWPHGHVTRDGRKARIVCTDRKALSDASVVVLVSDDNGVEAPKMVNQFGRGTDIAVINAPAPKREWWVNVYRDAAPDRWDSRDDADELSRPNRLACVHVTEGDGL